MRGGAQRRERRANERSTRKLSAKKCYVLHGLFELAWCDAKLNRNVTDCWLDYSSRYAPFQKPFPRCHYYHYFKLNLFCFSRSNTLSFLQSLNCITI